MSRVLVVRIDLDRLAKYGTTDGLDDLLHSRLVTDYRTGSRVVWTSNKANVGTMSIESYGPRCQHCERTLHQTSEKALSGDYAMVWADGDGGWVCEKTGDEHEPVPS